MKHTLFLCICTHPLEHNSYFERSLQGLQNKKVLTHIHDTTVKSKPSLPTTAWHCEQRRLLKPCKKPFRANGVLWWMTNPPLLRFLHLVWFLQTAVSHMGHGSRVGWEQGPGKLTFGQTLDGWSRTSEALVQEADCAEKLENTAISRQGDWAAAFWRFMITSLLLSPSVTSKFYFFPHCKVCFLSSQYKEVTFFL